MSSTIEEIGTAIQNLNATFNPINTTDILRTAIDYNNSQTNGWTGLILFIIMCSSIYIYIWYYRNSFNIRDKLGVVLVSTCIMLDIGIYLLIWNILTSFQIFFFIYTIYYILIFVSLIKKDMLSGES